MLRVTLATQKVQPPPASEITRIKRAGIGLATLAVDWQSGWWNYVVRSDHADWKGESFPPQTVVFNSRPADGKGTELPLTEAMRRAIIRNNGQRVYDVICGKPEAGWINNDDLSKNVTQRLSWAGGIVVLLEKRLNYYRVYAPDYASALASEGSFFETDHRLHWHKFNAVGLDQEGDPKMIKLGPALDCYTPFVSCGEMWIRKDMVEPWPSLPMPVPGNRIGVEYVLEGFRIYLLCGNGDKILIRDHGVFTTTWWRINSPEVPI
jgi:hypothetical protein